MNATDGTDVTVIETIDRPIARPLFRDAGSPANLSVVPSLENIVKSREIRCECTL